MKPAIEIRGLSKRYMISRQAAQPYRSLRDDIAAAARQMGRRVLRPWASGDGGQKEEFWALKDISLNIEPGQKLGIIGRNGSGKSTLLKILSRITEPTEGKATVRGRVASLLEVGTGFNPELTGRENIFLNGAILGMSQAEIRSHFDEIVDFAEIEQFLDTPVKRYSSGMYVRLAFAVAAHLESEILIVDEVLAVGDAAFQKKCLGKMDSVADDGRTVLFVSHSTPTVLRICTHALLLSQGRMMGIGPAAGVVRDYINGATIKETVFAKEANPGKAMCLRKVELNPEQDGVSTEVSYEDPISICVEYDVNETVNNCTVWVALSTMDGNWVFCSCDCDMDHSLLGIRKPGSYQANVHIPAKWLNFGEYLVIVGIVQNNPSEVYDREETLSFSVLEIGAPGSLTGAGVRRGVLQPYLPWTHHRLDTSN